MNSEIPMDVDTDHNLYNRIGRPYDNIRHSIKIINITIVSHDSTIISQFSNTVMFPQTEDSVLKQISSIVDKNYNLIRSEMISPTKLSIYLQPIV